MGGSEELGGSPVVQEGGGAKQPVSEGDTVPGGDILQRVHYNLWEVINKRESHKFFLGKMRCTLQQKVAEVHIFLVHS